MVVVLVFLMVVGVPVVVPVVLGVVGRTVVFRVVLTGMVVLTVVLSGTVLVMGMGVTLQSYAVAWSSHTSLGGLKLRVGGWHFMAMGSDFSLHLQ